ncbi:hypothetical protein HBH56_053380 [Parastagonospora nodorum]|uniref:Uncharacterized protein n=1 Tax=Phaeosphaeria nodorum (strain SN15 / ATCC MYA-4574 / FGSC 10173) TaxID=321614 RepID=A0A7U2FBI2_PHANO|nr:hypothetical protein HBH56_053380 [Parastagonospora nodorum]QRD02252.1 hypothetical protein JI435_052200 [Parastagonospora nodorum SN15]KAH3935816.1 hypothetical protein HBH54_039180 [Parastagonospora nodorum]KAH3969902.1 hypothetical protein HBH51_119150 [Parastagonospora nodorum]KAH3989116.1 hypothetical protein HBH52_027840 [Parastagonospora nodorum]
MACVSIGEANPDIAGIGSLVAFATQSLVAVFVSCYTYLLTQIIWWRRECASEGSLFAPEDPNKRWMKSGSPQFLIRALAWTLHERLEGEDMLTPTLKRLKFANRILLAGNDSQTFTGIALLISALVQAKTLSLYHMHVLYDVISLVVISNCAASTSIFSEGVFKGYIRISLIAIWATLFISYFGVFAAHLQDWNDNLPQHCYQTAKTARPGDPHPRVENIYIGITFACTLSTLCIATMYALKSRSHQRTTHATISAVSDEQRRWFAELDSAPDPTQAAAKFNRRDAGQLAQQIVLNRDLLAWQMQDMVVRVALFQCPLQIYSIFALRSANEKSLDKGSTEREWGFGQIVSMVLLGMIVLSVADGVTDVVRREDGDVLEAEMGMVSGIIVEHVPSNKPAVQTATLQA